MKESKCPEALAHNVNEATGKCYWCDKQLEVGYNPKPVPDNSIKSNDVLAYGYYLDPDFGLDVRDKYLGDV